MKKVRILVCSDFLRPMSVPGKPGQSIMAGSATMIRKLLGNQIEFLVDGDVEFTVTGENRMFSYGDWYREAGMAPTFDNWATLNRSLPEAMEDMLFKRFQWDLVIGWEFPWSMKRAFEDRSIPFIELVMHPIRFMDDFLFGADVFLPTSCSLDTVDTVSVARHEVGEAAGYVSAFMAFDGRTPHFERGSGLFVGQKKVDRAMITEDGSFFGGRTLADAAQRAIPHDMSVVYIKRHPDDSGENEAIQMLEKAVPASQVFAGNVYAALSSPGLDKIITVSSSVGLEAGFFGVETVYINGPSVPVHFQGEKDEGTYASLSAQAFSTAVLANLFRGTLPVRPAALTMPVRSPHLNPDRLRKLFGNYYAYAPVTIDPMIRSSGLGWAIEQKENLLRAASMSRFLSPKKIASATRKRLSRVFGAAPKNRVSL